MLSFMERDKVCDEHTSVTTDSPDELQAIQCEEEGHPGNQGKVWNSMMAAEVTTHCNSPQVPHSQKLEREVLILGYDCITAVFAISGPNISCACGII